MCEGCVADNQTFVQCLVDCIPNTRKYFIFSYLVVLFLNFHLKLFFKRFFPKGMPPEMLNRLCAGVCGNFVHV